jgi:hypothetical protein
MTKSNHVLLSTLPIVIESTWFGAETRVVTQLRCSSISPQAAKYAVETATYGYAFSIRQERRIL